jgi:hypothetical protein
MGKPNGKPNGSANGLDKLIDEQISSSFKADPTVTVTLGGKEYTLEYDNRAAKDIFKDTGINLLSDAIIVDALNNPEHVSKILLRGLQRHHPDKFTEDQLDEFLTIKHRAYILRQVLRAMTGFIPELPDREPESPADVPLDPPQPPVPSG